MSFHENLPVMPNLHNSTLTSMRLLRSSVIALLLALIATLIIDRLQLDMRLAQWLYHLEGDQWALKEHWLFSEVLHLQGRQASVILLLFALVLLITSFILSPLKPYRRVLTYLVIAPSITSGLVLLGKRTTGISCPWSLQPFGGDVPYTPLFQQLFSGSEDACFPAGHASAGYAWFALYFAAALVLPRWRFVALAFALGTGLIFGAAQELRGAHFLSHDIWSLAICWSSSALLAYWILAKKAVCSTAPTRPMMEPTPQP